MSGFWVMSLFYAAMAGVPILLWIISLLSPYPQYHDIKVILATLAGIGSIVFGVIGFREVFVHG